MFRPIPLKQPNEKRCSVQHGGGGRRDPQDPSGGPRGPDDPLGGSGDPSGSPRDSSGFALGPGIRPSYTKGALTSINSSWTSFGTTIGVRDHSVSGPLGGTRALGPCLLPPLNLSASRSRPRASPERPRLGPDYFISMYNLVSVWVFFSICSVK